MIPRGRPVITPADIAARAGMSLATWRRREAPQFMQRVRSLLPGRYQVFDLEQTTAYLDGKPIPKLPAGTHPDDLLTDTEAAEILQVSPHTVRAYRVHGQLPVGTHPTGPDGKPITSMALTPRRAIEERLAALPPDHTPRKPGRPAGTELRKKAAGLIDRGEVSTGKELAQALNITRRHGDRLMADIAGPQPTTRTRKEERKAQVRELLSGPGDAPSLSEIAERVGISKTTAARLVDEVRSEQGTDQ